MGIRAVVDDEVEDDSNVATVAFLDEPFGVGERAISWIDVLVVGDIVAHIRLRAGIHGGNPYDIDAQVFQIVERGDDAWDIADPVSIRIFVAGRPDLVDGSILPPRPRGDHPLCRCVRSSRCRWAVWMGGADDHPGALEDDQRWPVGSNQHQHLVASGRPAMPPEPSFQPSGSKKGPRSTRPCRSPRRV